MARVRREDSHWWRVLTKGTPARFFCVVRKAYGSRASRFLLLVLAFLTSCGNPSSNSNNINFPFGISVCSYTCNIAPSASSPTPISKAFAAVTSYGTHQVLIFYYPTNSTNPYGFNINNNSLSPSTSLYNWLQGPDGLLISSQGFTTSSGFSCPAPVLYGSDGIGNKISIWCSYDPSNTNNPGPTITINSTSFLSPEGMALDWVDSAGAVLTAPILFVANSGSSNILAFDLRQITGGGNVTLGPSGDLLPGTNGGLPFGQPANSTALNGPAFVAFSNSKNTLFVSNTGNSQVNVYGNGYCLGVNRESGTGCPSNNQNIPPTAWISGTNTYLSTPAGLVYYQGSLYVADYSANAVLIWDNVLNTIAPGGNVSPTRRINGSNTGLNAVYGISIDDNPTAPPGNIFFLSQVNAGNLLGYNNATTASGNIAPTFNINVINPTLSTGNGSGGGTTGYPGFF